MDTPLFRVRDKKQTFYCYSEKEKKSAVQRLRGKAEITRFKGLGEISPDEFGTFIGENIKLDPVILGENSHIENILEYYMGKNTSERQEFIISSLRTNIDQLKPEDEAEILDQIEEEVEEELAV